MKPTPANKEITNVLIVACVISKLRFFILDGS